MELSEIAASVKKDHVKAYELRVLRDAYFVQHSELGARRNSKLRMPKIKEALRSEGIVMWPDVLPDLKASRMVYLAERRCAAGVVFEIQRLAPSAGLAQVLADLAGMPCGAVETENAA
ncbi:hypothetical protein [Nonomuraea sp. NPDC050310]|uniref:hypothetical protein n=1 Tax=Nonomuraea sp. NPDC050310 TaxID=3154935 RepID=UPI0033DE9EE6